MSRFVLLSATASLAVRRRSARRGADVRYAGQGRLSDRPLLGGDALCQEPRHEDAAGLDGQDDDGRGGVRADRQATAPAQQDVHGAAGNVAEVARARRRLDHVPVGQRAGQRREPPARHRHLVRQRCFGRAGRMHRRDRTGLRRPDERAGQEDRPHQQPFRQYQRLARRGRDLRHRARPRDPRPVGDREPLRALQEVLFAAELHLGQDDGVGRQHHPAEPQPDPRQGRRRGRP